MFVCVVFYSSAHCLSCANFLSSAPICILLFFYLLFTQYWLVSVLYAVWWFYDYDTPARGGRRVPFLCGLKLWDHMRDYFPIKVSVFLFCFLRTPLHQSTLSGNVQNWLCLSVLSNLQSSNSKGNGLIYVLGCKPPMMPECSWSCTL